MEDQTIQDIEKAEKSIPCSDGLVDLDSAPSTDLSTQAEGNVQDDHQGTGDTDGPSQIEEDIETNEQLAAPDIPSEVPLRRSTRDRHPPTRYSTDEYVEQ
ncbi:hypothetical protein QYF36_015488 [Acer negundo]|nr:hypothetical protein QYF36_015488 [Acer negundo]